MTLKVDRSGFFTPERQQRLDLIKHLIPNSHQPVLLRGPAESGKTFFINEFKKQVPSHWLLFDPNPEELAASPLMSCELIFDQIEGNEKPVKSRLVAWSRAEKTIVLLIEDAHLQTTDCIEALMGLSADYACLRIVLTSSENLGEQIEERCQLVDLEPFSQRQTLEYAKERVSHKGMDFVNLAGIDDVVLFIETGGLPGRINDVLEQMQVGPLKSEPMKKQSNNFFILSAVLVSAGIALALTYGFWGASDESPAIKIALPSKVNKLQKPGPKKAPQILVNKVKPVKPVKPVKLKVLEKVIEPKTLKKKSNDVKPIVLADKQKLPVEVSAPMAETVIVEEKAPPIVEALVVKKELPKEAPKKTELELNHSWLSAQDKSSYTLQLLGVSKEVSAKEYLASKNTVKSLRYFQNKKSNGAWFTVIYGLYLDKASAESAQASLPSELKGLKPWIRSIQSVQGDMYTDHL